MGTQTDIKVDRARRRIASAYRKQGYRVIAPSSSDSLPPFLRDCHPDLIAEKEDDHVVIEVKPARALKGANDLLELTDRVVAEPGWRLELVTVRSDPEYPELATPDWLSQMLRPPGPGTDMGHHCIYLGEVLAFIIRGYASLRHIRTPDETMSRVARELTYGGYLGQDILDQIENALEWLDRLMRRHPVSPAPEQKAVELEKLCRELHAQMQIPLAQTSKDRPHE